MKPLVLSFSTSRYPAANFGEYLRKARLEKGLKRAEVARMVGVDEMTIVRWERHEMLPMRNHRKVQRTCDYLGLIFPIQAETYHRERGLAKREVGRPASVPS